MTDIPQELVERVARALWEHNGSDYTYEEAHGAEGGSQQALLEWTREGAANAIAAMLDGVALEWETTRIAFSGVRAHSAFGTYFILGNAWRLNDLAWTESDAPESAALDDCRARLLKAMGGV